MPTINFNNRSIQGLKPLKPGQEDYWDDSFPGFGIRVSSSGRKTWFAYYRVGGRKRRLTFGTYPTLSLADARLKAREALHDLQSKGVDPASIKRADREADTFGSLAQKYLDEYAKLKKKSWEEDERILNHDILPIFRNTKAKDIKRRDVRLLLTDTVHRGAPILANRILALIRKIFNFAIEEEIVEENPCWGLSTPAAENQREKVLNTHEIRLIWNAIGQERPLIAAIFKLYLLTAQRGAEVRSMAWGDLDLESGWWTIPGEKTKNGKQHRVPLNSQALAIIENLRSKQRSSIWVFPSPKTQTQHIDNVQKAIQRVRKTAGIEYVGHDFRRTAASHMTSLGIPRLTVKKILNHADREVTAIYDRHSYDEEKKSALYRWGEEIEKIVRGSKPELVKQVSDLHAIQASESAAS